MADNFDDIKPRGAEEIPYDSSINKPKEMEKVTMPLPNNYGVENFVKTVKFGGKAFDGIYEAMADDGKISLMEGISLGVSLAPQAVGVFSAIPQIPQEIVFDQISEEDFQEISQAFDDIEHLKGDTRDASREMLQIIFALKDWYFKYFQEQA